MFEFAMARDKAQSLEYLKNCVDTFQEHVWKIAAYGNLPLYKREVAGWAVSISKHVVRLQLLNRSKRGGNKSNLDHKVLTEYLVSDLFDIEDVSILNRFWKLDGYPNVANLHLAQHHATKLAKHAVDCILAKVDFDLRRLT